MAYGYDKNVDYQKLIHQDLVNQDYRSAAIHEAQRNEKIQGEGATQYQTTNLYSDWLPLTDQVNQGLRELQQAKFEYNPETDPSYQAYRKEYLREADRQTRDTMGAYAGMTGGVPSTAAVTAAQQAGNYQRARLTDKLPELRDAAYGRFSDEQQRRYQELGLLDNIDMERWQLSQEQQNAAYARELQAAALQREQQQNSINLALQRWQMMGYADAQVAEILGVPVGTLTTDQTYQNWVMQQQGGTGATGGSGGGAGGSGTTHGASVGMGGGGGYNQLLGIEDEEPIGGMGGYGGGSYTGGGGYTGGGSYTGGSQNNGGSQTTPANPDAYTSLANQAAHVTASNRDTLLANIVAAHDRGDITDAQYAQLQQAIGFNGSGWNW